ncbi:MAG: oligopeptide transporter, OPT family [Fimbriiglobus sp.]|nr:oligopeptide transporter, OPT family [Fimbriiglobus sp.]
MSSPDTPPPSEFKPFVPADQSPPEFTLAPIIVGSLLGIVFGASSIYLVLKVGMTVSASIPVAVLAFALFRVLSAALRTRKRSVLENNLVQTAGSAGESIAFGVGLVMPALLVLGFDIDVVRVMTVGVFGGLLGILMMIPLRRAFIVNKHGELKYPEGTACADVLKAGEQGGSTAGTLVVGLIIGFVFQFVVQGFRLFKDVAGVGLAKLFELNGKTVGLKGASLQSEMSAPLLGVGYIIGPKIAGIMVAGGVLAYLIIGPIISTFGENQAGYIAPAKESIQTDPETGEKVDHGLIKNMNELEVRKNYILYIGAGAVAAGGIISMLKALPVIVSSLVGGLRDLTGGRKNGGASGAAVPRTERDVPLWVVVGGSLGMIVAMMAAPQLGLGFNWGGVAGAVMILLFGFLFVTVSSRLTGEIGSSSNPISGMTVATLLLTCLILLALSEYGAVQMGKELKLLALTIAGVVCIASSNGGTTSQALKTGHLLGATPKFQTYAILIGSLTSALVVGLVLIVFNAVGTVYTKNGLPAVTLNADLLPPATERVATGQYADDPTEYKVLLLGKGKTEKLPDGLVKAGKPEAIAPGRYLVSADGTIAYRCDPAVTGQLTQQDNGEKVQFKFEAPKTQLVVLIIDGILDGDLPWDLVLIGIVIAVMLELCGLPSLAFAVGVYLPLSSSVPIFLGGMVRWLADKLRNRPDEGDSSPGVLLSSGYIAGGSIAALIAAGLQFMPSWVETLNLAPSVLGSKEPESDVQVSLAFAALAVVLLVVGVVAGRGKK